MLENYDLNYDYYFNIDYNDEKNYDLNDEDYYYYQIYCDDEENNFGVEYD